MSQSPHSTGMLSLVQCVQEYPVIWDIDNMFYKNVRRTNEAWCDVARNLQLNKGYCRVKWGRLRNSFFQMVTPDGKINYNRIRCNATLYENMKFLLPIVRRRKAKDDYKENVSKENNFKKISKLLNQSMQENQKVIANSQGIEEQLYEPILSNNFGDSQVFSHWPSTLCTPALQLNWITPIETIVANSSSSQQNNEDCLTDILKNAYPPKMYNYEMKRLEKLITPDKTAQKNEEIYTESEIQEANSYFR